MQIDVPTLFSPISSKEKCLVYLKNIYHSRMTANQIKTEIQKVLDTIPEVVLEDVLEYLKSIQNKSVDSIHLSRNLRKILMEDKALLEKLAK